MSIKKTNVVFDLDDTLTNSQQFCGEVMVRTIQKYDPNVLYQEILNHHESIRGKTMTELYQLAITKFKLSAPLSTLLQTDADIMAKEFHHINLFGGTANFIKHLKSTGKSIHICTNRKSASLIPILEHNHIRQYFDNIISCVDQGYYKPNPQCLTKLILDSNQPKENFLYVGDCEQDKQFAANANVDCLIFNQYQNHGTVFKQLLEIF